MQAAYLRTHPGFVSPTISLVSFSGAKTMPAAPVLSMNTMATHAPYHHAYRLQTTRIPVWRRRLRLSYELSTLPVAFV